MKQNKAEEESTDFRYSLLLTQQSIFYIHDTAVIELVATCLKNLVIYQNMLDLVDILTISLCECVGRSLV